MERYVAVDNVCAWPNLKVSPDGDLLAFVHNQPTHGQWEADVDCWASPDGGRTWTKRGTVAPHEPRTNRMNIAAGLARNGDLIVIAAGYSNKGAPGTLLAPELLVRRCREDVWVCRSRDGGRTWTHTPAGVPRVHPNDRTTERCPTCETPNCNMSTPYGDIVPAADGTLAVAAYHDKEGSFIFRSPDDGRTWGNPVRIAAEINETALLQLLDGAWLAVGRTNQTERLALYIADPAACAWGFQEFLTLPGEHPGHLLALGGNQVLLTYGMRLASSAQVELEPGKPKQIVRTTEQGFYGIGARLSTDGGRTWSAPRVLVDLDDTSDGGYPSSVRLDDGTLVTVYYANRIHGHRRYHMGVTRWRLEEFWTDTTSGP